MVNNKGRPSGAPFVFGNAVLLRNGEESVLDEVVVVIPANDGAAVVDGTGIRVQEGLKLDVDLRRKLLRRSFGLIGLSLLDEEAFASFGADEIRASVYASDDVIRFEEWFEEIEIAA